MYKDVICDINNKVWGGGAIKEQRVYMQKKLNCYHFPKECCNKMFFVIPMVNTKIHRIHTKGNEYRIKP